MTRTRTDVSELQLVLCEGLQAFLEHFLGMDACLVYGEVYVLELGHEQIGVGHNSLNVHFAVAEDRVHPNHSLYALGKVTYVADASSKETLDRLEPINVHLRELACKVEHLGDSNRMTVLIIDGPNNVIFEVFATANVVYVV